MVDPLAQAGAALEQALDAVHAAENSTPADDSVAVPSAVAETASEGTVAAGAPTAADAVASGPIAQLVEAHLAKSATPTKPRFLDMGKGYLGPTAINGT